MDMANIEIRVLSGHPQRIKVGDDFISCAVRNTINQSSVQYTYRGKRISRDRVIALINSTE